MPRRQIKRRLSQAFAERQIPTQSAIATTLSPIASQEPAQSASTTLNVYASCRRGVCCAVLLFATILATVALLPLLADVLDPNDALQSRLTTAVLGKDDAFNDLLLSEMPGRDLAAQGARAHHPIVIIPGITSTPLEVWAGKPCMSRHVRSRVWGEGLMLQKILLNPLCWFEHITLNETSGLDPDGIKLRASSGMRALETLADAFTLWGALLLNAAELGYDESNMHVATYDWRLSFTLLEARDRYFTRLKLRVEELYELNGGTRVVVVAHSMGALVYLYFQQWVSAPDGEQMTMQFRGHTTACNASNCYRPSACGDVMTPASSLLHYAAYPETCAVCNCAYASWVDKYVAAFVNVAGPLLGTPKAIPALLSGEMRTTADMPAAFAFVKEAFISRASIRAAFRSFGSMASMWPMGGNRFWGGERLANGSISSAPDQEDGLPDLSAMLVLHTPANDSEGAMAMLRARADGALESSKAALAHMLGVLQQLKASGGWEAALAQWQSDNASPAGIREMTSVMPRLLTTAPVDEVRLTIDDVMTMMHQVAPEYAVRLEQAVNASASRPEHAASHPDTLSIHAGRVAQPFWMNPLVAPLPYAPRTRIYCLYGIGKPAERAYHYTNVAGDDEAPAAGVIANTLSNASTGLYHGVQVVDGDAAVSILSLGYMCVHGWHDAVRNPGGSLLVTREYRHLEADLRPSQPGACPVPVMPEEDAHV